MIGETFLKLESVKVTASTLVGYFTNSFPLERGNCFSVEAGDGEEYRIVNFALENLEKLLEDKVVDFPVLIHKLADRIGTIADPRIPDEWYMNKFCTTCTPRNLLPYPQKLKIELDIMRGLREERELEINGKKMIAAKVNVQSKTVNR